MAKVILEGLVALVPLLVGAACLSCVELLFPLLHLGQGVEQLVCEANSHVILKHSVEEHIFVCFSPELGRKSVCLCSLKKILFSCKEMER